jgi:OPT family oligopeptide transporter
MAGPVKSSSSSTTPTEVKPYISAKQDLPEFTWSAVLLGAILGIIFGASSLYLVLKIGMTVSASIPVAVMSITLFRWISKLTGMRSATILENNIVQTTGSAGESIAFGLGVTMPALLALGFDIEWVQVMTVGVLGGLLGILIMIPLRRAFIVKQHGVLPYPEGTACAEVLITGEKGGSSAKAVFFGFGLAFLYNTLMKGCKCWADVVGLNLSWTKTVTDSATGKAIGQVTHGIPPAELATELSPELLGVGYIIGPKIAGITFAGGVLAYLVMVPMVMMFGQYTNGHIPPAKSDPQVHEIENPTTKAKEQVVLDHGLIANMNSNEIRKNYIQYIGAGAVATGGLISLLQSLPLIIGSAWAAMRDLRRSKSEDATPADAVPRTELDLPLWIVLVGCLTLIAAIMAIPSLGLGFTLFGLLGAGLIIGCGCLFVTVSARLTGSVGSSSNPISGMTICTLLITCLVFVLLDKTSKADTLAAMMIAAVVCIASSNGGTTAQDLKTGYLVGATPKKQQYGIIIGALTSALVIGVTLLLMNKAGTVYTKQRLPNFVSPGIQVPEEVLKTLTVKEPPGNEFAETDKNEYLVAHIRKNDAWVENLLKANPQAKLVPGRYLVDDKGVFHYYVDPLVNGNLNEEQEGNKVRKLDNGNLVNLSYDAPKTRLMTVIIDGVLSRNLPWSLIILGGLIAVTLELAGISALPFAVGVYLPIDASAPIFIGGMIRWVVDWRRGNAASDDESGSGIMFSSGYIAGGSLAAVIISFMTFLPENIQKLIQIKSWISAESYKKLTDMHELGLYPFLLLAVLLLVVGLGWLFSGKTNEEDEYEPPKKPTPAPNQNKQPNKPPEKK